MDAQEAQSKQGHGLDSGRITTSVGAEFSKRNAKGLAARKGSGVCGQAQPAQKDQQRINECVLFDQTVMLQ